jgi:S-adenosylmethionine:tRNA ribosyltransferase-isomerase
MDVELDTLRQLIAARGKVIAVGTTSLRTLESLYWMGVKAYWQPQLSFSQLPIQQWEVMDELLHSDIPVDTALNALVQHAEKAGLTRILCKTQIMMMPGYPVKMVEALITNFHQPQSTLLLLVAAMIGEDWRKVYDYALGHEFRFLSYGDGSLLWRNP